MRRIGSILALAALAVLGAAPAAGAAEGDPTGRPWEVAATVYVPGQEAFEATGALGFLNTGDGSIQQMPFDYLPYGIAYAPDARTLYTVGFSVGRGGPGVFAAHDASTGELLWATIPGEAGEAASWYMSVALTPDGALAMTTGRGEARIDLATQAVERFSACAESIASGVAITPDGRTAWFVCAAPGTPSGAELRAFDVATLELVGSMQIPSADVAAIAITPDGATAVLAGSARWPSQQVVRVELATGELTALDQHTDGTISISPDGTRAYVGTASELPAAEPNPSVIALPDAVAPHAEPGAGALHAIDVAAMTIPVSSAFANYDANPVVTPDGARIHAVTYEQVEGTPISGISTRDAGSLAGLAETPLDGIGVHVAVTPDQAPVARLTASEPHSPVTFDASASSVEFGTIAEYAWDFGDGTTTVTSTPVVQHEYASAGQYTATVRLTSSGGTSTEDVFTGQQLLRNGDPSAIATVVVTVPRTLPATGFDGAWIAAVAAALLFIGAIALVATQRRRARR
ncbi:PKD domain-containing protein [Agromyces intestinalis]|uniref:PKD domain-containing protein n=1 Tax=Agromyces intestinalis TaxID=2592652 RepID=A0A5C1YLX4_9MICO|nr:PKD domain-containing protein [Agromyces intestinalis]QEO15842.1 PKD domain-containing protein [Agromyces intestinalis]